MIRGFMEIASVKLEIPDDCNVILGQTHFIKTAEDLYEIIATTVPQAQFGIAFSDGIRPLSYQDEGNDSSLIDICVKNLQAVGAGHVFCILLKNAFPDQCAESGEELFEVCRIFCATATPLR